MIAAVARWFMPELSLRRLAIVRSVLYAFMVVDCAAILGNPFSLASSPEFYVPVYLAQLLHLPPLAFPVAVGLFVAVVLASFVVVATGLKKGPTPALMKAQQWASVVASVAFSLWVIYAMSYGYVQHDHLAIMVAAWVLPTAPPASIHGNGASREAAPVRSGDVALVRRVQGDERAGWALRCIQIAVISTYFFSVLAKWVYSGSPATWANSAIFAWAFIRRGSVFVRWMLEYSWLFRPAQWGLLIVEILSPLVFLVKGRGLWWVAGFFALFHFCTLLALGIHFLPTVVCWVAFLPFAAQGARDGARSPKTSRRARLAAK